MKTGDVMLFSDMKLGESTVKFERQQLELYGSLVSENPANEYYQNIQAELARQLKEDENQLQTESKAKPQ